MAFDGNFSLAQSSESTISITDSSVGSDSNIISRYVTLYKYDNTTIVTSGATTTYINWPISALIGDVLTLTDILDKDYALNIQVNWVSTNPLTGSTYVKNNLYYFKTYNMNFFDELTAEDTSRNPSIIDDTNYYYNKVKFFGYLMSGAYAVDDGSDIYKGQMNLDKATNMRINSNNYF